jgi:hypothetical protein
MDDNRTVLFQESTSLEAGFRYNGGAFWYSSVFSIVSYHINHHKSRISRPDLFLSGAIWIWREKI